MKNPAKSKSTRIVRKTCLSKGDPIPSDYGIHHCSAVKFQPEEPEQ
jgi:hypothetical protein